MFAIVLIMSIGQVQTEGFFPPGSITSKGIFRDVYSRCPPELREDIWRAGRPIWIHEMNHHVSANIRLKTGKRCFYIGDGNYFSFEREPLTTVARVETFLPAAVKSRETYKAYFLPNLRIRLDRRGNDATWLRQPLYLIDEWCAHKISIRCGREEKIALRGQDDFEREFPEYGDALVRCVSTDEPGYPELEKLKAIVELLKKD